SRRQDKANLTEAPNVACVTRDDLVPRPGGRPGVSGVPRTRRRCPRVTRKRGRAEPWPKIATNRPDPPTTKAARTDGPRGPGRPVCRAFASPTPWSAAIAGAGFEPATFGL